jgi:acetyl-CoA carboxylase carboxyl transferase subunit beta
VTDRLSAIELIDHVLDVGSFNSWDEPVDRTGYDEGYVEELERAQHRSGIDEAVITGSGSLRGHPVAVIVSEFGFLGGSIGTATARRIVAAVEQATARRLPLLAATSSGGTRMQEGTPAFVEMVSISRAVLAHKRAGLLYLVYLRHPTTGGVFASWGSLGHVSVGEPGALIGFLGPRVYESLHGQPFPEGVQVAENLVSKGILDAVLPIAELGDLAARVIDLATHRDRPARLPRPAATTEQPNPDGAIWEAVLRTRDARRPGIREVLRHAATDVIPLSGTGEGQVDAGLLLALARLDGVPCVLVAQDRRNQVQRSMGPGALREARRGMRLAAELRLPLVAVIDTPGADLSPTAEEAGLAGEIARCLSDMLSLTVPTVSVLLGQGCGGGALALLPAARVIAAESAWLSPLPPEGASAIVYHDSKHAPEIAQRQRIGARDLLAAGIVHRIVAEPVDIVADPQSFAEVIVAECAAQIRDLIDAPPRCVSL